MPIRLNCMRAKLSVVGAVVEKRLDCIVERVHVSPTLPRIYTANTADVGRWGKA
jgi:hypothetical protein